MPLGFERLNERTQRPNAHINFIKTVSTGADKAIAEEFLSRIAAQCYPVMKKHYITVMALEEYPCNPEFLGRNFNAGEVIQLVLKDKQGRWLSFKFVQMVMMHELAHCKQMNHSKFFWGVRNEYAKHMEDLWKDKYEGEGLWGRGRGLAHGAFVDAQPPDNTQIPEHLCGGSYRRRGKKRKRGVRQEQEDGEKLSYAERQQKRIQKKLGKHGVSMKSEVLGDDELTRGALERMNGGKRAAGKPRVANSKRGRELRANAALARFETLKQQTPEKTPELDDDLGSETESEWEDGSASGSRDNAIVIKDEHGHDMVKVCGDGEDDEEGAGREMDELRMLSRGPGKKKISTTPVVDDDSETESEADDAPTSEQSKITSKPRLDAFDGTKSAKAIVKTKGQHDAYLIEDSETEDDDLEHKKISVRGPTKDVTDLTCPGAAKSVTAETISSDPPATLPGPRQDTSDVSPSTTDAPENVSAVPAQTAILICAVCSLENEPSSPTCLACSNVLRPKLMPNHWSCKSESCKDSVYINAGDAGRCGICGSARPSGASERRPDAPISRKAEPVLYSGADVLRWD